MTSLDPETELWLIAFVTSVALALVLIYGAMRLVKKWAQEDNEPL